MHERTKVDWRGHANTRSRRRRCVHVVSVSSLKVRSPMQVRVLVLVRMSVWTRVGVSVTVRL